MRILHTADLHLAEKRPETVDALKAILETASSNSADIVTMGGDIFDSAKDADKLRPKIRNLFRDIECDVVCIPGNHDGAILRKDYDFGFDVIADEPYGVKTIGDVSIVGIPYTETASEELLLDLRDAAESASVRILLLHCTLDWGYTEGSYGDEKGRRYFSVSRDALSALGYDYILAGHFHSRTESIDLGEGGMFVYPGSPVSHTTKETGRRNVVLIDTDRNSKDSIPLDTQYFDQRILKVTPGKEDDVVSAVEKWYSERADDQSDLEIIVKGVIAKKEGEFEKSVKEVAPGVDLINETKDVRVVLDHPVYNRFKEKLEKIDDENKQGVNEVVIEVISNLIGEGKL
ncbi:MAG: metallophosphoesterase family protein [Promethearchaeia archaeon]